MQKVRATFPCRTYSFSVMRWLAGVLSMVAAAPYVVIGCSKMTSAGASAADAGAEAAEETLSPMDASPDGTPPDSSADVNGAVEDGVGDGAFGAPGALCVPSEQYAEAEPCPPIEAGTMHTTFSCDEVCYSFHRVLTGPVNGPVCAVGGFGEAGPGAVIPYTEAGTVVLCCPGVWDAAVPCEWFPFQ